jgi:hypothetical protein
MNKKTSVRIVAMLGIVALLSSCSTVQEYQKVNLNDPDMKLAARKIERGEVNFLLYREGAAGANGGKTGGGCGCN